MKENKLTTRARLEAEFGEAFKMDLKRISQGLKKLRISRNMSVTRVARAMMVPVEKIDKVESGTRNFELGLLFDLCILYDANIEDVLKFNPEKKLNTIIPKKRGKR